jgi:hypothetical protein
MRATTSLFVLLLLTACGGADDSAPATEQEMEPAAVATPTPADFAGEWQAIAMLEGTPDPVPVVLIGSADGTTWTMILEDREPMALEVSMAGDSLIMESGQYESIMRDGVMVQIRTASVLQEGRLVGNIIATYSTPDGEQVVPGTMEGTRTDGV